MFKNFTAEINTELPYARFIQFMFKMVVHKLMGDVTGMNELHRYTMHILLDKQLLALIPNAEEERVTR